MTDESQLPKTEDADLIADSSDVNAGEDSGQVDEPAAEADTAEESSAEGGTS